MAKKAKSANNEAATTTAAPTTNTVFANATTPATGTGDAQATDVEISDPDTTGTHAGQNPDTAEETQQPKKAGGGPADFEAMKENMQVLIYASGRAQIEIPTGFTQEMIGPVRDAIARAMQEHQA